MPRILSQTDITNFRDRTCASAVELFVDAGYDGFTMRDLARRLGTSAMTPYRYFENKDEILALVKARGFAMLADRLEAALGEHADDRKKTLVRTYLTFSREEASNYKLMFDHRDAFAGRSSELRGEERRVRTLLAEHGRLLVGPAGETLGADQVSDMLWSLLHGLAIFQLTGRVNDGADLLGEALAGAIAAIAAQPARTATDGPSPQRGEIRTEMAA